MRKIRSDSTWNRLSRQQCATLDTWLFEENLSYNQVLTLVEKEFGLKASRASLGAYYQRRSREHEAHEIIEAQALADNVDMPAADAGALCAAAVKIIGRTTIKLARESPERVDDLGQLTKLLLLNENIEIRRDRIALENEQFRYKTAIPSAPKRETFT
jgi:hypothetical protein